MISVHYLCRNKKTDMRKTYLKLFSILLLITNTTTAFAQKQRSVDIDGSILHSNAGEYITFAVASKYNIWVNPYFAFSFGGRMTYSRFYDSFDSPKDNRVSYHIEDDPLLNLNGEIGLKLATPTIKGIGLFSDLSFLFDPIPFNAISVEKRISTPSTLETKIRNKMVYTHFNPNVSLKMGLLYKLRTGGQIAIGGEVGSFNPYNVYYRATVDNIKLRDHLTLISDKPTYSIFIRFSGVRFE